MKKLEEEKRDFLRELMEAEPDLTVADLMRQVRYVYRHEHGIRKLWSKLCGKVGS